MNSKARYGWDMRKCRDEVRTGPRQGKLDFAKETKIAKCFLTTYIKRTRK